MQHQRRHATHDRRQTPHEHTTYYAPCTTHTRTHSCARMRTCANTRYTTLLKKRSRRIVLGWLNPGRNRAEFGRNQTQAGGFRATVCRTWPNSRQKVVRGSDSMPSQVWQFRAKFGDSGHVLVELGSLKAKFSRFLPNWVVHSGRSWWISSRHWVRIPAKLGDSSRIWWIPAKFGGFRVQQWSSLVEFAPKIGRCLAWGIPSRSSRCGTKLSTILEDVARSRQKSSGFGPESACILGVKY